MSTTAVASGILGRIVKGPPGLRQLLQRLGPTFIKIGQFLALRPDLIPQEYCDELLGLVDQVPPFPWDQALQILQEDLADDPKTLFALINPRPVAAGSLAQTHAARLHDGTEVAIKVQRPNIRERVARDLTRANLIARVLAVSGVRLVISPRELLEELSGWLMQELDFKRELANLTRLYQAASDSRAERIPKPFPEKSGSRVLTAEFLRGVPVSEIMAARRSGRPEELERVQRLNVDWDEFAANLMEATLGQIFRYKFFHADLHPGNLLLLTGNTIGYVDFGLCDELDDTVRRSQLRYFTAVYNRNVEEMFRALTELLIPGERADLEGLRMDFLKETSGWLSRSRTSVVERSKRKPGERSPVAQWLTGVMRAARTHGFQAPPRILSMYRALLSAESIANELAPGVNLRPVGQNFFASLAVEEVVQSLQPVRLQGLLLNILSLWRDSPGQIRQILTEFTEGRFLMKVEAAESSRVSRARDRRTKLLATAILSVGVALLAGQTPAQPWHRAPIREILYGVVFLLYVLAFIQWRRLR